MFNLSHRCVSAVAVRFEIDEKNERMLPFYGITRRQKLPRYPLQTAQSSHTHTATTRYMASFLPKVSGNTVTVILVQYWHKTTPGHLNPYYLSLTPYDGLLSRLPFMWARDMAKSHPRQCKTRSFEWRDTRDREVLAQPSFVPSWTETLPEKNKKRTGNSLGNWGMGAVRNGAVNLHTRPNGTVGSNASCLPPGTQWLISPLTERSHNPNASFPMSCLWQSESGLGLPEQTTAI